MPGPHGAIELERAVTSIHVGARHRTDLGDLDGLAASIQRDGLLQPITVSPDGVLVCGARRLAAIKRLGWKTVNVWVRSGLSDRLGQLLAEQDDNAFHKPLTQLEAAGLYRELKALLAEDAARRQEATRFGSTDRHENGAARSAGPSREAGDARRQAATMVTGRASYSTYEKIGYLEKIAGDASQPDQLRARARQELGRIESGGPVDPGYTRIRGEADQQWGRQAELERLAQQALARVRTGQNGKRHHPARRPVQLLDGQVPLTARAFTLTWADLENWWDRYDVDHLAAELTDQQIGAFRAVLAGSNAFADRLHRAREQTQTQGGTRPHLRAL